MSMKKSLFLPGFGRRAGLTCGTWQLVLAAVSAFGLATVLAIPVMKPPAANELHPVVINPDVDAGTVPEGHTEHRFTVVNPTVTPIRLRLESRSCDCTNVSVPEQVAPGGSAEVVVSWNLEGRVGRTESALLLAYDAVPGSGRDLSGLLRCTLHAYVAAKLSCNPSELRFDASMDGVSRIEIDSRSSYTITDVFSSHPAIEATFGTRGIDVHFAADKWDLGAARQIIRIEFIPDCENLERDLLYVDVYIRDSPTSL